LALAQAVQAYAENIDDLSPLSPAIERICEKHVGHNIQADQYPVVGKFLLGAISETLGDAATPEILDAWKEGYQFLADVLIDIEKKKMEEKASQKGGWTGFCELKITKKVQEAQNVTSFYLKHKDSTPVPTWKAGQYVGVRLRNGESEVQRNYSLSCYPNDDVMRLTVKKDGLASMCLHKLNEGDCVKCTMPCGHFLFSPPADEQKPVVLIGLGIGVTPILPLAEEALRKTKNPVHVELGARSEETLALESEFTSLGKEYPNRMDFHSRIKSPNQGEAELMDFASLWPRIPSNGSYYFCGPSPWMEEVSQGLKKHGVATNDINFEFFGPTLQI